MIAPTLAEHMSDHCVRNVWSCEACGYQFEDTVFLSAREVAEEGAPEVFRLLPGARGGRGTEAGVLAAIEDFNGLPFSRRDLARFPRPLVEETLDRLFSGGRLSAYAPLVEASGRAVAQAEHTLHVGRDGVEVLTR